MTRTDRETDLRINVAPRTVEYIRTRLDITEKSQLFDDKEIGTFEIPPSSHKFHKNSHYLIKVTRLLTVRSKLIRDSLLYFLVHIDTLCVFRSFVTVL